MTVPPLLTFPARPIQGGRLELAPPKRGLWFAEPKLNGRRALIHTPSGTMWNRHGALLTIADCFRPALGALAKLAGRGLVWADCEALERRHNLGRGTPNRRLHTSPPRPVPRRRGACLRAGKARRKARAKGASPWLMATEPFATAAVKGELAREQIAAAVRSPAAGAFRVAVGVQGC